MQQFTISRAMSLAVCLASLGFQPSPTVKAEEPEWVTVGNPGNAPDGSGRGGVAAVFQIMRHEVTCGQYAAFLNAVATSDPHGLWDPAMGNALATENDPPPSRIGDDRISPPQIDRIGSDGSYRYRVAAGMERMPIVNVSCLDAMRFANWMHHRHEPVTTGGTAPPTTNATEAGSYDIGTGGGNATRSAEARVWIPSEDEWHKAAYHHPESAGGPPGGYWLFPTRSDQPPLFRPAGAAEPNSANFLDASVPGRLPPDIGRRPRSEFIRLFPTGSFPNAASFYGTLDQGGNAWEWTDSVIFGNQRILRGGSMAHPVQKMRSNVRSSATVEKQYGDTGFRLARHVPATDTADREAAPTPRTLAAGFFAAHCQHCHEGDTAESGLDLSALAWEPSDPANRARWIRIHDRVDRGDMPPATEPRPPVAETRAFVAHLSTTLSAASLAAQRREGRVVYRRLNRAEYERTLHDLLGIVVPLQGLLPQDATAEGFDTVAAAHSISAVHLERYLEAADRALAAAADLGPVVTADTIRTDFEQSWHDSDFLGSQNGQWTQTPEGLLAIKRGGEAGRLQAWSAPVRDARYRFRIRARGMIDGGMASDHAAPRIILQTGVFEAPDSPLLDQHFFEMSCEEFREFEFVGRVPEGPRKTLFVGPFRAMPGADGVALPTSRIAAVVEWVEIEGPLREAGPQGRRRLFGNLPIEPVDPAQPDGLRRVVSSTPSEDARRLLATFLPLAFRRPVTDGEIAEHLDIVLEQLAAGRTFDEALRAGYKLALCSPRFLFLEETPGALDDYALAARLSYGLHGTAPDAELRGLAAAGMLRQPAILRAQTERLLAAPESQRFIQAFLASWLNLRDIDFTQPDSLLYPEFDPYLQQSMVAESEAFFSELLANDLPAANIVHSGFGMLNERLAEHYGISGVTGHAIRRVLLPPDSRRGGVLTQGAVLKVTANGTTTSPVIRGAYVLDRILGTPPDPPPRNVPALEPDTRGATTIREQLAKHRDQVACAGCHAKLDPPGFALESYDVTGAWRSQYRVIPQPTDEGVVKRAAADKKRYVDGPAVDASGRLADGRSFADIDGLKRLLLDDPAQVARCLTEKLVIHLTGATIQFADREMIEAIVAETASDGHGVRSLVHAVIQSRLFTHK